jgi:hypothetical protein
VGLLTITTIGILTTAINGISIAISQLVNWLSTIIIRIY